MKTIYELLILFQVEISYNVTLFPFTSFVVFELDSTTYKFFKWWYKINDNNILKT